MNIETFLSCYYPRVAVLVKTTSGKYFPFDVKDQEGIDYMLGQPAAYTYLHNVTITDEYITHPISNLSDWILFVEGLDMSQVELLNHTALTRKYLLYNNEIIAYLNSANPNMLDNIKKLMYGI